MEPGWHAGVDDALRRGLMLEVGAGLAILGVVALSHSYEAPVRLGVSSNADSAQMV